MTLELATEVPVSTPVELLVAHLLDREWEAQSGRTAPLEPTATVQELLELVLAGTPRGIFAAAVLTDGSAVTPEELVAELRDELPAELSPWTLRATRRAGALRRRHRLPPAGYAPPLPTAAPEREAQPQPFSPPEAEPFSPPEAEFDPAPKPEPEQAPVWRCRRRAPFLILAAVGTLLGAGIGAANAAVLVHDIALGAIAGLAAAGVATLAGGRQ
jgi:hypothetical protein